MTLSFNKFHVCFKFKILKLLVSKTGTSNFKVEFQVSKLKLRVSASFIRVSAKFQKKLQVSIKFSSFFFKTQQLKANFKVFFFQNPSEFLRKRFGHTSTTSPGTPAHHSATHHLPPTVQLPPHSCATRLQPSLSGVAAMIRRDRIQL